MAPWINVLPEPSAWDLFIAGLAIVVFVARRRTPG